MPGNESNAEKHLRRSIMKTKDIDIIGAFPSLLSFLNICQSLEAS